MKKKKKMVENDFNIKKTDSRTRFVFTVLCGWTKMKKKRKKIGTTVFSTHLTYKYMIFFLNTAIHCTIWLFGWTWKWNKTKKSWKYFQHRVLLIQRSTSIKKTVRNKVSTAVLGYEWCHPRTNYALERFKPSLTGPWIGRYFFTQYPPKDTLFILPCAAYGIYTAMVEMWGGGTGDGGAVTTQNCKKPEIKNNTAEIARSSSLRWKVLYHQISPSNDYDSLDALQLLDKTKQNMLRERSKKGKQRRLGCTKRQRKQRKQHYYCTRQSYIGTKRTLQITKSICVRTHACKATNIQQARPAGKAHKESRTPTLLPGRQQNPLNGVHHIDHTVPAVRIHGNIKLSATTTHCFRMWVLKRAGSCAREASRISMHAIRSATVACASFNTGMKTLRRRYRYRKKKHTHTKEKNTKLLRLRQTWKFRAWQIRENNHTWYTYIYLKCHITQSCYD